MTHPTKAIVGTLLKDFVKVSGGRSDGALYSEKDLEKTLDVTEVIDFHQTVEVEGIKVCIFPVLPQQLIHSPAALHHAHIAHLRLQLLLMLYSEDTICMQSSFQCKLPWSLHLFAQLI